MLPGRQRALAEAVFDRAARLGKRVSVVRCSPAGRWSCRELADPRPMRCWRAWFLGAEAGNAVADIVTGARSPSGRTPVSWPRAVGADPDLLRRAADLGRPCRRRGPLHQQISPTSPTRRSSPSATASTYGRFTLSNLTVTPAVATEQDTLAISVDIANEGTMAAEETGVPVHARHGGERGASADGAEGLRQDRPRSPAPAARCISACRPRTCASSASTSSRSSSPERSRSWSARRRIARGCCRGRSSSRRWSKGERPPLANHPALQTELRQAVREGISCGSSCQIA